MAGRGSGMPLAEWPPMHATITLLGFDLGRLSHVAFKTPVWQPAPTTRADPTWRRGGTTAPALSSEPNEDTYDGCKKKSLPRCGGCGGHPARRHRHRGDRSMGDGSGCARRCGQGPRADRWCVFCARGVSRTGPRARRAKASGRARRGSAPNPHRRRRGCSHLARDVSAIGRAARVAPGVGAPPLPLISPSRAACALRGDTSRTIRGLRRGLLRRRGTRRRPPSCFRGSCSPGRNA